MLTRFGEFDRFFPLLSDMQQHMDALWQLRPDAETAWSDAESWPRARLIDEGDHFTFYAEVPGLHDKDVTLTLNQDVLTVSGERKTAVPDGYQVHRRDRAGFRFSRSYSLPVHVDAERVTASLKHGALTVTLPKQPSSKPRQIAVRAQ
jgi:HSP20 family protein